MAATRPLRFSVQAGAPPAGMDWWSFARWLESIGYGGPLRVGTFVLDNDFRNPLLRAREAATVDVISNGAARARHRRGLARSRQPQPRHR